MRASEQDGREVPLSDTPKDKSAVPLGPHLVANGGFDRLYREGMRLIEEVAAYLDGPGRDQSRALERETSFVYATESMRLTTRLMQMASWLLLHRAAQEGEISAKEAISEKAKINLGATPSRRGGPGWEELPAQLRGFIEKGDDLLDRVNRFDRIERGDAPREEVETGEGGVADQMARLHAAFGKLGPGGREGS